MVRLAAVSSVSREKASARAVPLRFQGGSRRQGCQRLAVLLLSLMAGYVQFQGRGKTDTSGREAACTNARRNERARCHRDGSKVQGAGCRGLSSSRRHEGVGRNQPRRSCAGCARTLGVRPGRTDLHTHLGEKLSLIIEGEECKGRKEGRQKKTRCA